MFNRQIMKIIYNNIIPFRGFVAINLFGLLFVRKEYKGKIDSRTFNHESIHTAQMRELLYLGFYLAYVIEWCIRLFMRGNAYRNISFEREAYSNESDVEYLKERKHFAFVSYLRQVK